MAAKKAPAKGRNNKAVAESKDQVPAHIKQGQSRGSENVSQQDIMLPRLDIIQDLSPQHKENKPEYIPGAKVGMLFNTLTGDLYEDGANVVPVYYDKQFLVWKLQSKGGGLKGVFSKDEQAEATALAEELGEEHECVETPTQICILLDEDGMPITEISVPMAKSKMKINRQWNSLIRMNGGDRFSRIYRLTSVPDQNQEGQEYLNYKVTNAGWPGEEAYEVAEKLYDAIVGGDINVGTNYQDAKEGEAGEKGEPNM